MTFASSYRKLALCEADSLDQLKGQSFCSLIAPAHQELFKNHVARVFAGESATLDFEITGLRGTKRWLSSHAVPFRNSKGDMMALLGITRDITEQRALGEQLRHAQKMEAIGQLAGGIAHDFNNILSAIVGYSDLMRMGMPDDDPMRMNVDQILEAAQKAATLTHSLLAFSKKQLINLKPLDLNELIRRLTSLLRRLLREDIELATSLTGGALTVMADSGQLEQIVMNLTTNARDAMPQGGRLSIHTELVTLDKEFVEAHGFGRPGAYALVSVGDSGTGMDNETLRKVFDPFFTTKELGQGTGLGLSTAYGIVKQHEGYINVYSESGRGTTFRIYLPIVPAGTGSTDTVSDDSVPVPGGTETILVAEDDPTSRKILAVALTRFGYTVIEAADGEEAVLKFRDNKDGIRLAILDCIMPKLNGREVHEAIMNIRPDTKTIFVSGYTADIFSNRDLLGEGAEFMTKPIRVNELARKIREVRNRPSPGFSAGRTCPRFRRDQGRVEDLAVIDAGTMIPIVGDAHGYRALA